MSSVLSVFIKQLDELNDNIEKLKTIVNESEIANLSDYSDIQSKILSIGLYKYLQEDLEVLSIKAEVEQSITGLNILLERIPTLVDRFQYLRNDYFNTFILPNQDDASNNDLDSDDLNFKSNSSVDNSINSFVKTQDEIDNIG